MPDLNRKARVGAWVGIIANLGLAAVKLVVGTLASSAALVADAVHSLSDAVSSIVVLAGLKVAAAPPDARHPYGHGKAESVAALAVCLLLIAAACGIAYQSIVEIRTPYRSPAPYTLLVLVGVVTVKELLFRKMHRVGRSLKSTSLQSDAWHHRSDALTSLAAFVGISVALLGGERFASADAWAALVACGFIFWNGARLLRLPIDEVMDAAAPGHVEEHIRHIAEEVPGVRYVEKCRVRKSGVSYLVDLHITVSGRITVADGHRIAHRVKDRLLEAGDTPVADAIVHVEPD